MADLNELNEKVEQIKADIREQLEKIENTKGEGSVFCPVPS